MGHSSGLPAALAAFLALGDRELREEVLLETAEQVPRAARLVGDLGAADEVDELAGKLDLELTGESVELPRLVLTHDDPDIGVRDVGLALGFWPHVPAPTDSRR